MKYRILGRTGLKVSEVGFGAWGIGKTTWIGADDTVSLRTLFAARDAGINFFDTALVYGRGHSERLIGQAFGKSKEVFIATKMPPLNKVWPAKTGVKVQETFPRHHAMECLEKSLANLGRDAVDLYQFHVWSDEWVGTPELHATIEAIRRSGKARFIGISINDHQPDNALKAIDAGIIDTVQVIYNIFDQSPQDSLLQRCTLKDIGVIARVPFDEGGLTGAIVPEAHFPEGDFRSRYFAGDRRQQVMQRVQRIASEAEIDLKRMPELALRFCLSHPAITTVIPGMRRVEHVMSNVNASERGTLSPELLEKMREHRWVRNFYIPEAGSAEKERPTLLSRMKSPRLLQMVVSLFSFRR